MLFNCRARSPSSLVYYLRCKVFHYTSYICNSLVFMSLYNNFYPTHGRTLSKQKILQSSSLVSFLLFLSVALSWLHTKNTLFYNFTENSFFSNLYHFKVWSVSDWVTMVTKNISNKTVKAQEYHITKSLISKLLLTMKVSLYFTTWAVIISTNVTFVRHILFISCHVFRKRFKSFNTLESKIYA